jgi:hypothetical protein
MSAVRVGQCWKRKESQGDGYDEVKVVGEVFTGETSPPDWSVAPVADFAPPLQTSTAGLTEYCELVEDAPTPGAAWEL